jgi:hypothetical protein
MPMKLLSEQLRDFARKAGTVYLQGGQGIWSEPTCFAAPDEQWARGVRWLRGEEQTMTYVQVAEDRESVSVVNEEGDVLAREVPAELILLAVPLLVTAAAVVATMPEGQRHTRPAMQLANMVQDICDEAGISQQGLRQMIIHAGLSDESQN